MEFYYGAHCIEKLIYTPGRGPLHVVPLSMFASSLLSQLL